MIMRIIRAALALVFCVVLGDPVAAHTIQVTPLTRDDRVHARRIGIGAEMHQYGRRSLFGLGLLSFGAAASAEPAIVPARQPARPRTAHQARRADDFLSTIGVNIHPHYNDTTYANYDIWKSRLLEGGFRSVSADYYLQDGMTGKPPRGGQGSMRAAWPVVLPPRGSRPAR